MTRGHEFGAGRVWQGVARAWLLQSLPLSERSTRWAEDMKGFLLKRIIRRHKKKVGKFISQLRAIREEIRRKRIGGGRGTGREIKSGIRAEYTCWSGQVLYNMLCSVPKTALLSVSTRPHTMSLIALILKPVAYIGLPAYLLHRLSQASPFAAYYIRNILYVVSLGFSSGLGFCAALPLYLVGRRYDVNYVGARTFYSIYSRLVGVKVVVEGEEYLQMRPCVYVGNHQTMLDVFWLGRCVVSSFTFLPILIVRIACSRWAHG